MFSSRLLLNFQTIFKLISDLHTVMDKKMASVRGDAEITHLEILLVKLLEINQKSIIDFRLLAEQNHVNWVMLGLLQRQQSVKFKFDISSDRTSSYW